MGIETRDFGRLGCLSIRLLLLVNRDKTRHLITTYIFVLKFCAAVLPRVPVYLGRLYNMSWRHGLYPLFICSLPKTHNPPLHAAFRLGLDLVEGQSVSAKRTYFFCGTMAKTTVPIIVVWEVETFETHDSSWYYLGFGCMEHHRITLWNPNIVFQRGPVDYSIYKVHFFLKGSLGLSELRSCGLLFGTSRSREAAKVFLTQKEEMTLERLIHL